MVFVIDHDVGDLGIAQQGLERSEAEDLVEKIGLDLLLLVVVQGNPLVGNDLLDDAGDGLARLRGVHARQLLQIELRDQRSMDFRFVVF
jgi:hypothetical protein